MSAHASSQRAAAAIGDAALVRVAARAGRPLKTPPHETALVDAEQGGGGGALLGAQTTVSERTSRKRLCTFGKSGERPPLRREYGKGEWAEIAQNIKLVEGGLPVRYAPSAAGVDSEDKATIIEVKSAGSITGGGGGGVATSSIGSAPSLRSGRRRQKHSLSRGNDDSLGAADMPSRLPQITVSDNERDRRPPVDVSWPVAGRLRLCNTPFCR